MGRKDVTKELSKLVEMLINPHNDVRIYWAKEVTFDYSTSHPIRVDYMCFKPINNTVSGIEKGDFYCYEIKSSVEDFKSKNGHNFIGDFNYYIMQTDVYEQVKHLIPWHIGVYVPEVQWNGQVGLTSVKKAKRQNRERPISEMLLMMFRSANRELIKIRKQMIVAENCPNENCRKECLENEAEFQLPANSEQPKGKEYIEQHCETCDSTEKENEPQRIDKCKGCYHYYDSCGYDDSLTMLGEEKAFEEYCEGCCCCDGFECNKESGNGCNNYEKRYVID